MGTFVDRWHRLRTFLWKSQEPVTRTILAINVLTFLASFIAVYFVGARSPWSWLTFLTLAPWQEPWSLLTYPLVTYHPLSLLLTGYWLWIVGGSLERSWTSQVFLRFFAAVTLATSLGLWIGSLLLGAARSAALGITHVELSGLWMPLAALTVAWCLLNPDQIVLFGFILPIPGRHLLWLTIALTYFLFAMGYGTPWLAFFALSGVAYAYSYTRRRAGRLYYSRLYRPPTVFERALDWLALYWERLRRRLRL
jgi:membrane associated rhomboid family serine protease